MRVLRSVTVAALPVVTFGLYYQTLAAPFIFDDRTSVTQNLAVQFRVWGILLMSTTRPLANISYVVNFVLGGLSPWGYHLGNILLHAVSGLLVYACIRLILRLPRLAPWCADAHWPAFAVSLLFVVHPLQTEVVAYISSRNDALAGLFVLAAMTCLALALHWCAAPAWDAVARAAAAVCVLLAVLSKESGAVTPLLLFLLDWAAAGGGAGRVLRSHWLFYAVLGSGWVVPVLILLRHPEYAHTAGFGFSGVTPVQYLCSQFGVILHYIRLTLVPYGQVLDYDWPVATSLMDPSVLLPGCVLLAGAVAAVRYWRSHPLHCFCVWWFFITLAPTSSIVPIADLIAERRMYLPILGVHGLLALLIGDGVRRLRLPARSTIAALLFVAAVGCAVLTWQRNVLWSDPELMWQDSARKAPGNPRIHANLGTLYAQRGQPEQAKTELELAAQLIAAGRSRQATRVLAGFVYTHLASTYVTLHDLPRARAAYEEALANGAWGEAYLRKRLTWIYGNLGPGAPPPG